MKGRKESKDMGAGTSSGKPSARTANATPQSQQNQSFRSRAQSVAQQNARLIKNRLKVGANFEVNGVRFHVVKNNRFYGGRRETDYTIHITDGNDDMRIGPENWRTVKRRALSALGI